MASPGIHTARLSLRELTLEDHADVARMLGDPEVMRYYPKVYTAEEARDWVLRQIERYGRDGHALWRVGDRETDAFVGQCGLVAQVVDGIEEVEIGFLIDRPHWRRGYATEAASAVRDWGFRALRRERLVSLIDPANQASQRTALKIGMRLERETAKWGKRLLVFSVARSDRRPS